MDNEHKEKVPAPETVPFHFGSEDANSVYIFGDIDETVYGEIIIPMLQYSHENKPLEIYVNTDGGDPVTAMTVGHIIDRLTIPTTIILMGDVCSAGFLIAVAGNANPNVETVAFPSTRLMWHKGYATGHFEHMQIHEIEDFAAHCARFDKDTLAYIAEHTVLTPEDVIMNAERKDWWLDTGEMVALGIIDRIL